MALLWATLDDGSRIAWEVHPDSAERYLRELLRNALRHAARDPKGPMNADPKQQPLLPEDEAADAPPPAGCC